MIEMSLSAVETLGLLESPLWMAQAKCADADPEDFFTHPEDRSDTERVKRAIAVCRMCPVQAECLKWAYEINDGFAVLGATTAKQRRHIAYGLEWGR